MPSFETSDQTRATPAVRDMRAAAASGREGALRRIAETLLLSSQTLARDPSQLAGQMLGRLLAWDESALAPLVDQAGSWRGAAWLRPVAASLSPAGGALVRVLTGHEGTPRSVAVSPDGLVAASAGNSQPDQAVYVWDVRRGSARHALAEQAEPGQRTPIALARDSRTLLTGYGGELRVFDLSSGQPRPPLARRETRLTALAAAGGAPICLAAWEDGALTVCDLESGRARDVPRGDEAVLALSLSADGSRAAAGSASGLELVDLTAGCVAARRPCDTGLGGHFADDPALALSADGTRVYHGLPPQTWLPDGDETIPADAPTTDRVLAISPAGRAVCAPRAGDPGGLVVCDLQGSDPPRELPPHPSSFSTAAVTLDGRLAVCADYDHWVTVWRLDAPAAQRQASGHARRVWRLAVAGDHAVSASVDGDVKAWVLADGREADASSSAADVAAARDRWAEADELDAELSRATPLARSTDGTRHWARTPDGAVAVGTTWDGLKYAEVEEPVEPVGEQRIPVRVGDGSLRWLAGHAGPVTAVVVSPDGRRAVSGGFGRIVRTWDLARCEQLHALAGHAGAVWDAAAVPGAPWVVTASEDGTIVLWDFERGVRLAAFTGDHPMLRCAVAPDGRHVVAGDVAGGVHVLRVELPPVN